ncbi:hypothetical protein NMG60_11005566 [Bertholletia excelsa]
MGEKDAKTDGGEQKADAPNKDDGPVTVILKLDMHCEGCARKIKRAVRHFDGVERVKTDAENNKLTVTGKVDPTKLKERVAEKTQKKVDIVSPQPKKDGVAGDKKSDDKSAKKSDGKKGEDKKPKEAQPSASTVILKTALHCDGCRRKIKRIVSKTKGVDSVTLDAGKNIVTVRGTMDGKELASYLKEKMKQDVEIVPPNKEGGGGGEKKETASEGGGDKKEKEGSGGEKKDAAGSSGGDGKKGGEDAKVNVNKLEYYGYSPYAHFSMPAHSHGYVDQGYLDPGYGIPVYQTGYPSHGYANPGYVVEYSHPPPPPPPPPYLHGQMFSDENPNGCSVM